MSDNRKLVKRLQEILEKEAPLGKEPLGFYGGFRAAIFRVIEVLEEKE